MKYSKLEIIIRLFLNENGDLVVLIKDRRRGMSEKYMLHLFDIFRQERQDYISKFDGDGLALVKKGL